ncbi:MAG: hypothetical protein KKH41_04540 [Candidatus Thermoplasmatota archaeon]|nr:hypothetical protein [Euryarchaeota archaeon]MBU4071844.1 hypothetical protein [Candidatus Thermoplasmatota archaeon]MBU4144062.1 hypothetical protein [Candidatus Thermoplasmatota archaeon]MBU4591837.1 hypothetical protein [Candidatus Thermoplasmatota archaeon]
MNKSCKVVEAERVAEIAPKRAKLVFSVLIKNWHHKAKEQDDDFSKFVFEYLAFIAFLRKYKFIEQIKDRPLIQKIKCDIALKEKYIDKIKTIPSLSADWKYVSEELNRKPLSNASYNQSPDELKWWNCSYEHSENQSQLEKEKRKGVIHSLEDWENMVEFWYIVRNNLFHGAKDPENERDQFAVEYGYKTLSVLVRVMIEEEVV